MTPLPDTAGHAPSIPLRVLRLAAALLAAGLAACTTSTTTREVPLDTPVATTTTARAPADPADADRRARLRVELGSAYFARGQTDTALEEVRQALAAKPDLPEAYNLRGLIYASQGEFAQAEESFRRALQINPRYADAMHNWAWVLCQQRRFGEADAMFQRTLDQPGYREITRTLLARGVCQARDGRLADAEATLTRAYQLDPANPAIAVNLSEVLLKRGEFQRARFYVARVNAQPEQSNAQTLWLAARIEQRLGDNAKANEFGRQLKARFPQSPETLAYEQGRFDD
jgi:type IV pilus assembly protein PilF